MVWPPAHGQRRPPRGRVLPLVTAILPEGGEPVSKIPAEDRQQLAYHVAKYGLKKLEELIKFRHSQLAIIGECQRALDKMAESRTLAGGGAGAGPMPGAKKKEAKVYEAKAGPHAGVGAANRITNHRN